jgi:hypothetical protein
MFKHPKAMDIMRKAVAMSFRKYREFKTNKKL